MKKFTFVVMVALLALSSMLLFGCSSNSSSAATIPITVSTKSFDFFVDQKIDSSGVTLSFSVPEEVKDGDGFLIYNYSDDNSSGAYYFLPMEQELFIPAGAACDILVYSLLHTDSGDVFDGNSSQKIKINIGSPAARMQLQSVDIKSLKNVITNFKLSVFFRTDNFSLSVVTSYVQNYIVPPYVDIVYCTGRFCYERSDPERFSFSENASIKIEPKSDYWGVYVTGILPDNLNNREIHGRYIFQSYY